MSFSDVVEAIKALCVERKARNSTVIAAVSTGKNVSEI